MSNDGGLCFGDVALKVAEDAEYSLLDQLYSATRDRDRLNDMVSLRYLSAIRSSHAAVAPMFVHNDYQSIAIGSALAAERFSVDFLRVCIADVGHRIYSFSVDPYETFDALATRLENETATMSSPTQILQSPFAREFKNMGRRTEVINRMLSRMETYPIAWMVVLSDLTGENPISKNHRGHVKKMIADWKQWGRSHNFTN